ncbi:hypothetical protein [Ramlibacter tataouinensis]|nr:hypothetical protein [Ramlibacter tataouinensis]
MATHQQMALTEESRMLLAALLRDEMKTAVREGIREAMSKQAAAEFAIVFLDVMKQQAGLKMDTWAGGVIRGVFRKMWENAGLFLVGGMIVYSVGGWAAVAKLAQWVLSGAAR